MLCVLAVLCMCVCACLLPGRAPCRRQEQACLHVRLRLCVARAYLPPHHSAALRRTAPPCVLLCARLHRELAQQTFKVVQHFVQRLPAREDGTPCLTAMLMVGGTDVAADIEQCASAGCNLVVATPGRLLDMMTRLKGLSDNTVTFKVSATACVRALWRSLPTPTCVSTCTRTDAPQPPPYTPSMLKELGCR